MWYDIKGWEGFYKINKNGDVINSKTLKIKKPYPNSSGYLRITLENKKHKPSKQRFFVHRLVAMQFLSNPNNYKEVNHKDSNILNNSVYNLEWCNKIQNELYSHKFGRKEYKPYMVLYNNGKTDIFDVKRELAQKLNVTSTLIKHWLHNESDTYKKYGIKQIYYI